MIEACRRIDPQGAMVVRHCDQAANDWNALFALILPSRVQVYESEIANVTNAIADGLLSSALSVRLRAAEQKLETLKATATVVRAKDVVRLIPAAVERYRKMVDRLGDVDLVDIQRARATIRDLIAEIEVEPRYGYVVGKMGLQLQAHPLHSGLVARARF